MPDRNKKVRGHSPRVRKRHNMQTGADVGDVNDDAIVINTEKIANMVIESAITGVTALVISRAVDSAK